jgi:hypothetical protein
VDVTTAVTFFGSQPTDILEDFAINSLGARITEVTVQVPAGAAFLFLSTGDQLFNDNSDPDGDYKVEATIVGCWTDLGFALAGAGGEPALKGTGTLLAGDPTALLLTGGKASSTAALIVGFSALNAPFKSGTLVPAANIVLAGLPTDVAGAFTLPFAWPGGLPAGFSLYFQMWIVDATAPRGCSASNGLSATTP